MGDPKSLVIYWHEKVRGNGPRAPPYSTVTNWIRVLVLFQRRPRQDLDLRNRAAANLTEANGEQSEKEC
jgi:hypothetical protein